MHILKQKYKTLYLFLLFILNHIIFFQILNTIHNAKKIKKKFKVYIQFITSNKTKNIISKLIKNYLKIIYSLKYI